MEQRQGRAERDLLLRDEPVAGRGAPAAASLRDLHLGGRRRLLSRPQSPRRHPLHVRAGVVPLAGRSRPARPRHEGIPEPYEWRLGLRATHADRGGARRQPPRLLRGLLAESPRQRRVLALAHARLVEGHRAALLGGQLGRAGAAPAGQLRGVRALGVEAEVARGARHRALDPLLHGLRRGASEEVLRPLPEGRGDGVEKAAEGRAPGPPPRRAIRRAARDGMAARAHAVDQALPEPDRPELEPHARRAPRLRELRRPRRGRHVPHAAPTEGNRDYRPHRGEALRVVADRRRRPLPDRARADREHEGSRVPGCARPAHADRAGMAPRLASEAGSEAHAPLSAVPHARREAAAHAREDLRARRRDLADLDRGAGRVSNRPDGARTGLRVPGRAVDGARNARRGLHRRRAIPAQRPPRPAEIFGKKVTIHCGPGRQSYLVLPIIPSAR